MSGGSQHNPNGRQSQLGSGWSPLQVANFLARAPQAHMASERGVTWHTPTPPPHLYHVPAPSPPDPLQGLLQLQAMKAGGNSVFRHTATPPELYRHTPTPPDKHLLRHTPSPGDVKGGSAMPPAELYPHLGPGRDKLRPEELGGYPRTGGGGGVDLSLGTRSSNGGAALSVRDAPTINSLIARAQPRAGVARVDSLLERLAPAPSSPHSVIVAATRGRHSLSPHSPHAPLTPTLHSENEDSTDSCGAPPGSKRKRKPERIVRVSALPPATEDAPPVTAAPSPRVPEIAPPASPLENGDTHKHNGPDNPNPTPTNTPTPPPTNPPTPPPKPKENPPKPPTPQPPEQPTTRRKARSGSAETIDDIAAMIASTDKIDEPINPIEPEPEAPVTIDKLKSVLASPDIDTPITEEKSKETPIAEEKEKQKEIENEKEVIPETPQVEAAAAPKRRSARISNSESTNVPVESPSEAKPAEPETSERSSEPTASSFVEVENQLEKMFAGIEEETPKLDEEKSKGRKRRKSAPTKGESKVARRGKRASSGDGRKGRGRGRVVGRKRKEPVKDAYDSGSNASSGRSRGPYIQIRGPRDSPLSVAVVNAAAGDDDAETAASRRKDNFRNGLRTKGLHASTLGLRYDATTADATWLCAFCQRGPHAAALGDLFGPYTIDTDCEEYRALDEATRRKYDTTATGSEVWVHESCAVWAPGVVACGARVWGLASAVWSARGARCQVCMRMGAGVACSFRGCRAAAHLPCATAARWRLPDDFQARCPSHAPPPPPPPPPA